MPGNIDSIILKLAARCNLNCRYCYIYTHEDTTFRERPPFISDTVFERALAAIRRYCDRREPYAMSITFHGGGPTLIGAERVAKLASRAQEALGDRLQGMSIQTNATLLDSEWIRVLRRHHV